MNSNWSYSPETPNLGKNRRFFSHVTLQFNVWPWKTIGHLFYATSSFVHHFVAIGDFKLVIQSGNGQFGSKSTIFRAVWPCNLTYDLEKQPLLCYFKLCASFHSHRCVQTWVTVRKRPIWVKIRRFLELCDLEIWRMTLKHNREPAQCCLKPCASFRSHWWNQTGVTLRKRPIWVKFDDF